MAARSAFGRTSLSGIVSGSSLVRLPRPGPGFRFVYLRFVALPSAARTGAPGTGLPGPSGGSTAAPVAAAAAEEEEDGERPLARGVAFARFRGWMRFCSRARRFGSSRSNRSISFLMAFVPNLSSLRPSLWTKLPSSLYVKQLLIMS